MNLNKIRPKNDTEDIILLITKKCETLNKQTHEIRKKHLNLRIPHQEKLFHLHILLSVVLILFGWMD